MGPTVDWLRMNELACVSVLRPVVEASRWEMVHLVADGAVILAVLVGVIELWSHRRERRELAAAIDDHIRVLAIQAWLQVQAERPGRGFGPLLTRLMTRVIMPGDLMATWLTTIAAEAPRASSQVRRDAREVARVFFALAIATKKTRCATERRIPSPPHWERSWSDSSNVSRSS